MVMLPLFSCLLVGVEEERGEAGTVVVIVDDGDG